MRYCQRHVITIAETWAGDRSGPWQHTAVVSQSHILIAGSSTRLGKRRTQCHCVTGLPMFSSLSGDCNTYAYVELRRRANSNHWISDFRSEKVQTRTGWRAKNEIQPYLGQAESQMHSFYDFACKLILFTICSYKAQTYKTRIPTNTPRGPGSMECRSEY